MGGRPLDFWPRREPPLFLNLTACGKIWLLSQTVDSLSAPRGPPLLRRPSLSAVHSLVSRYANSLAHMDMLRNRPCDTLPDTL